MARQAVVRVRKATNDAQITSVGKPGKTIGHIITALFKALYTARSQQQQKKFTSLNQFHSEMTWYATPVEKALILSVLIWRMA